MQYLRLLDIACFSNSVVFRVEKIESDTEVNNNNNLYMSIRHEQLKMKVRAGAKKVTGTHSKFV